MIIGVDCDGVLTDMSAYVFYYGEKWFKRKPENLNSINTRDIFNCTERQEFLFGLRYFFKYCKNWPPREYALEAVKKLEEEGHKVYQITARKFTMRNDLIGRHSRYVYENWLKKYGFKFNGIYYCSESSAPEDKLEGVRSVSADIMIDDHPDVAMYLAEKGVKVLLFDTRYNKNVKHKNIMRVYDWKDVYNKITSI